MPWETLLSRKTRRFLVGTFFVVLVLHALVALGSQPLAMAGAFTTILVPALLAAALLARQYFDRHERRAPLDRWVAAHLSDYQQTTPSALAELFAPDSPTTGADLAAAVEGVVRGAAPASPLTQTKNAAAWRLDVDLVRPSDLRWNAVRRGAALDALVSQASADGLALESGGVSLRVGKDAQLLLADAVERVVPWSELSSLGTEASRIVKDALDLRDVPRDEFSGVRVEESVVAAGQRATVFGVVRKTEAGLEIVAGPSARAPLVLTTYAPRQVSPRRARDVRVAAIARVAGAVALLLFAIVAPWNRDQVGTFEYVPGAAIYSLDVKSAEMGASTNNWVLKTGTGEESIQLTVDSTPLLVDRTSHVAVSRVKEQPADRVVLGRESRIGWTGSRWMLEFGALALAPAPAPTPTAAPAPHDGALSVRNRSKTVVRLRFEAARAADSPPTGWFWAFNPDEGTSSRYGQYLVSGGKQIRIATGDAIELSVGTSTSGDFTFVRRLWAGESPEVAWVDGTGWTLDLDDGRIATREAELRVRNPTRDAWTIHVLDEAGNQVGQWDIDAGLGTTDSLGTVLTTGDSPELMRPGFVVELRRSRSEPVWQGPLAVCPWARFDAKCARWTVAVREERR